MTGSTFPPLPAGMSREECIQGLRGARDWLAEYVKDEDPTFRRWPDLDALLDYIEANGFPPPENTTAPAAPSNMLAMSEEGKTFWMNLKVHGLPQEATGPAVAYF